MKVNNGFIYPLFDSIVKFFYYYNLVELFKFLAKLYVHVSYKRKNESAPIEEIISSCNVAIDIYQVFKWGVLAFLWACEGIKGIKWTYMDAL